MLKIENKKELALSLLELAMDPKIPHGLSGFDSMAPKFNKGGYVCDLGNPMIHLNPFNSKVVNLTYLEIFLTSIEKTAGPDSYIGISWNNEHQGLRVLSHYKWVPKFIDVLENAGRNRGSVFFNCTTKEAELI